MAFGDYLGLWEEFAEEIEAELALVESADLAVAAERERELRAILADLSAEAEYIEVAGVKRVNPSSQKTRRATKKAIRRVERWQRLTIAAYRASDPEGFLAGEKKLAEVRRIYNRTARNALNILRRFNVPERFTPAQIAESRQLARELGKMRNTYGPALRDYFGDMLSEAEFGKVENLAAGVRNGAREPINFIARWSAGTPGNRVGRVIREGRVVESTLSDLTEFTRTWKLNRNQLSLSSIAHLRGLVNSVVILTCQALGVGHFMFYVAKRHRPETVGLSRDLLYSIRLGDPDGSEITVDSYTERVAATLGEPVEAVETESMRRAKLSGDTSARVRREMLGRMLLEAESVATWPEIFDAANAARVSSVPWAGNLTIHHGSREFYVPIPPTLLAEARAWAGATRSRMAA